MCVNIIPYKSWDFVLWINPVGFDPVSVRPMFLHHRLGELRSRENRRFEHFLLEVGFQGETEGVQLLLLKKTRDTEGLGRSISLAVSVKKLLCEDVPMM